MSPPPDHRFRVLFDLTYERMVAYARRRVPAADVDDVVAEVYATAWRRFDDFTADEARDPVPWLYGVAHNVVRATHRADGRRRRLVDRIGSVRDGGGADEGADDIAPERAAIRHDDASRVRAALASLPESDQEVLRLAVWDGLSHDTIGELLGVRTGTVTVRLHRARNRLARALDEPEI